jgi:hypothetical protein
MVFTIPRNDLAFSAASLHTPPWDIGLVPSSLIRRTRFENFRPATVRSLSGTIASGAAPVDALLQPLVEVEARRGFDGFRQQAVGTACQVGLVPQGREQAAERCPVGMAAQNWTLAFMRRGVRWRCGAGVTE